jgi:hypothetical protein
MYCKFCRNVEVTPDEPVCEKCKPILDGPLIAAMDALNLIGDHYRICCQGIKIDQETKDRPADDGDLQFPLPPALRDDVVNVRVTEIVNSSHLYVHPKDFESTDGQTTVECGVTLYVGHARCYWIFDSDRAGVSESREYGPEISYQLGAENFLAAVDAVLHQGALYAAECGIVSCPHCGDHHHESMDCDCQEEAAMRCENTMNPYCDDPPTTGD